MVPPSSGGGSPTLKIDKGSLEENLFKSMERRVLRWILIVVATNVVTIASAVTYITNTKNQTDQNAEAIAELKRQNVVIGNYAERMARSEAVLQSLSTQNERIEDRLDSVIDQLRMK